MEQNDFLSAVLPTQGKYCTFIQKGKVRKNIFVNTLENLYDTNIRLSADGNQTYFALATFDDEGSRESAHAVYMRALFIDLDCGQGKAYPTKRAAVEALNKFMEDTGLSALGRPWLVDSGGGVHGYLPLTVEVPIAEWKPVAEALKRAGRKFQFNMDMTVTADAARVLRQPGTTNFKYDPPRPVVLRQRGDIFDLDAVAELLAEHTPALVPTSTALTLPGVRPQMAMTAVAKALVGTSITLFRNILKRTTEGTGCAQLEHYFTHAQDDGMEPLWRGWLSIATKCDDGEKACIKLTKAHPYDMERMQQKLSEIKGPYPCAKFDSENPGICGNCPHWGKIINPLALGRELKTTTEESVVERETEQGTIRYDRPKPPYRFSYGDAGGVFYTPVDKKGEDADAVLVVPYDLYMTRMFRDGRVYQAEFTAIKGDKQITFVVPNAVATSQTECIKKLAENNVIAAHIGYDSYLYQYVRQSMQQASAEGNEVVIPPNFGWQADDSFAFGDKVYSPHSPEYDYEFVSDRLSNVVHAVECRGTLVGWRSVVEMVRRKQMWGHLAIGMTSFASALMHFMPAGTRACSVHVCGKNSGMGKSFALAIASTANGDHEKYKVPANTSKTTLMQRAGFFGSCPTIVDEVTTLQHSSEREFMPNLIFDFSQGQHKLKGSASGNAEIAQELFWEGLMLTSANTPVLEAMMGARQVTSEGEARRLLEWHLPDDYKLVWGPGEFEIAQLLKENYGVAMRKFVAWLVVNQDKAREVTLLARKAWIDYSGATDDERFWASGVGAYIAACILCGPKYADIVDVPWEPIMEFWLRDVVNPARAIINSNQAHAMDILNAYIRENNPNFVQVEGSIVMQNLTGQNFAITPNSDKRAVRGRVERNVTPGYEDLYIEAKMLKVHCASLNRSYSGFIKELGAVASVSELPRKDLLAGTKGPAMRVAVVKITRPI